MRHRLDPAIEQILPNLPLRDPAKLTPQGARDALTALAASRSDLPLPQPAAVADIARGLLSRRRLGRRRYRHP
jgi:hypothetical protein